MDLQQLTIFLKMHLNDAVTLGVTVNAVSSP